MMHFVGVEKCSVMRKWRRCRIISIVEQVAARYNDGESSSSVFASVVIPLFSVFVSVFVSVYICNTFLDEVHNHIDSWTKIG